MLHTATATRGMMVAPHHLAAQSGLAVLREGGNAVEAMVAAAAAIAVTYPHMNGLGGDAFWLIHEPGRAPLSIDASGAAARGIDADFFRSRGLEGVPVYGPLATATVAGTVSGWHSALEVSGSRWGGRMPLARLLEDAIAYARDGFPVTSSQHEVTQRLLPDLAAVPGFSAHHLSDGAAPAEGARMTNPALAQTLALLVRNGLDDFYRGTVGRSIAADLKRFGSPLEAEDLARHRPVRRRPLSLLLPRVSVFNAPPPTQGLAALMILGLVERAAPAEADGFAHVHAIVEATKIAFKVRNAHITDPLHMGVHPTTYLNDHVLDKMAVDLDPRMAAPWPARLRDGDTVYLCCADREGRVVSFIQSLFHGFGSGVVLPETGITWHDRAASFSLDDADSNGFKPGRKPRHTLAPALAKFKDGRVMAYGSMGGDGQPQTQAAVFTRYARFGQSLQAAVSAPRWVLGKSYGGGGPLDRPHDLKIENRFDPAVIQALTRAGHDVAVLGPYETIMGHANALVVRPDGVMEGAADPRSDGGVAGF